MADSGLLRVAVITPYFREDISVLRQCHQSVLDQTHPCVQFMVADGHPNPEIDGWDCRHLVLPEAHGDYGNTPRAIGSLSAASKEFDAIAYLDGDNWYRPEHIENLVALHRRTGAAVCSSGRTIHRVDGSEMYEDKTLDGETFVDTNCMFLTRKAFRLAPLWALMPRQMTSVGDRVFWQSVVASGLKRAHSKAATVAFRSLYTSHYEAIGETPPEDARTNEAFRASIAWWDGLPEPERKHWQRYLRTGRWS